MSCASIRERLADPRSMDPGDRSAIAEHVEGCEDCRGASRAYASIERLFRPEKAGEPPADFEARVLSRLTGAPPPAAAPSTRGLPVPALVGGAAALLVLVAILAWRRRKPALPPAPPPAPTPENAARTSEPAAPEAVPPPALLAVNNAPLNVNAPPLTNAERARVLEMYDADYLLFEDALAALDAFYPEDLRVGPPAPGAPPEKPAARPPESADARELRLLAWRSMSRAERERVEAIDKEYRTLPSVRRAELEHRWLCLGWVPPEEKVGMRRLVARFAEMDPSKAAQVQGQIRRIAAEPVERRGELWRSLPFTKGVTGQEQTAGERVLICR